jgi:hypothetical protein
VCRCLVLRLQGESLSNPSYSTQTAPGCYAYAQTAAHRALVDLHLLRAFDDSVKLRVTLGVLESLTPTNKGADVDLTKPIDKFARAGSTWFLTAVGVRMRCLLTDLMPWQIAKPRLYSSGCLRANE